jgi:hypothetical protein
VFESLTKESNFILYPKDIITTSMPSDNLLNYYKTSIEENEDTNPIQDNKKPSKEESNDGETKISNSEFLNMVKAKLASLPKRRLN